MDCLRQAREWRLKFRIAHQCRAQAISMMREEMEAGEAPSMADEAEAPDAKPYGSASPVTGQAEGADRTAISAPDARVFRAISRYRTQSHDTGFETTARLSASPDEQRYQ